MRKHINSETVQFQDIITDNLVLDAKATEGSFNAITSDAVFRAVQEGGGGGSDIPEVTEDDNGKVLKAVYDKLGPGVEWSDVDVGLTGGDGISVDNNTVAVKVGEGLHIATYRKTEDVNNDSYVDAIEQGLGDSSYSLPYIVPMADVFEEINSTSSFHLNNSWFRASTDFNDPDPTPFYWAPAIVLKSEAETVNFTQPFSQIEVLSTTARQSTKHWNSDAQIIEGEADGEGVTIPISFDDINQDLSNFHFDPTSQPQDPELYALTFVLVNSDCTSLISGDRLLGWSNDLEDFAGTFSYERTVRTRDALNVSNPVPSYSDSDAGKVLSVNSQGTGVEWVEETIPTVDQTYDSTSANAQSGTAVAEAIAGVNQVPASTSTDANKVLTVDSQGVPGWVTQSGGGGDSDEWWGGDPGYITTIPSGTARLRFKDITYDPRNDPDSTFIAKFNSITKVSDGVYDFACKSDQSGMFQNKYTTDNEFILVGLKINFSNCIRMFQGCTGLRAVYNLECSGYTTSCSSMFRNCTNLMEVRCGINRGDNAFNPAGSCDNMFYGCHRLKSIDMYLPESTTFRSLAYMCGDCKDLEVGPSFGANVNGCNRAFYGCKKLQRFSYASTYDGTYYRHSNNVDCTYMFNDCMSLQSLNGLGPFFLGTTISNASSMFDSCIVLQEVPYIKFEDGTNCSAMFNKCAALNKVPEMDWGNITNMSEMFKNCSTLSSLNDKDSGTQWYSGTLNASLTNVSNMFSNCFGIREHLLDCYNGLSANAGITTTTDCFKGCGTAFGNPDLASIPSAWGGDGA